MQTTVFLWVIAAAMVSLALAVYQYFYKNQNRRPLHFGLATLRFLSIFCGLLLLMNITFTKNEFSIEKSKLLLLVDNSKSMLQNSTPDSLWTKLKAIQDNPAIKERFDVIPYSFGRSISSSDSITFTEDISNIGQAMEKSAELFTSANAPVLLFTDGNQTTGKDYEFSRLPESYHVWPIVVGDTTSYQDLAVSQVNLNKYAFLGNQFPVESVITYQGEDGVAAQLQIFFDAQGVYREQLQFQKGEKSKNISSLVTAKAVGVKSIRVSLNILDGEQNTANNVKETAIEVIDEKTKVLLVSDLTHPDIGAIKKAIESNEQRTVELVDSNVDLTQHEETDVIIAYQPASTYQSVYDFATTRHIPLFTVIGTHTDLAWVNSAYRTFLEIELGYPEQEVFGEINSGFPHFNTTEFDFDGYPPLNTNAAEVALKVPQNAILDMTIKGIKMNTPLMTLSSEGETKNVFLFGEDIWKWRLHSYRENGDFSIFDDLFSKMMVYLAKSGKRNRLEIEYQKVYDGSQELKIRANFYDQTYVQDNQADLTIQLKGQTNSFMRNVPMLLKGSYFEIDVSDLKAGEYDFVITENSENISRQGSFKILDFDAENQIFTANHEKLARLALKTKGRIFYENQLENLIESLIEDDQFVPVQKNNQKIVPLIDFRWLLGLMAITLSAEWFIRKYNGLL